MTEFFNIILIKLIIAHLICDFFIQTDKFCEGKNKAGYKGWLLQLLHAFSHALIAYVLVAKWTIWQIPLVIGGSHLIIDIIKTKTKRLNSFLLFIIDQITHTVIIVLICLFLIPENFILEEYCYRNVWIYALGYITLLKPTSILISMFFKQWDIHYENKSLPKAGRWIGYFERILVMTFILLGSYEAIGFLMAAKSIFRFGDLKDNKEIKMTEYVLVGTLMSFTIAVIIALGTNLLIRTI